MPALLCQTLALGTLACHVGCLQLLALEGAHARLDFGVGTRAITRRNFGRRFGAFAFLFDLDQAIQFNGALPRSLFCRALGSIAQLHLSDRILFRDDPLGGFNFRLLFHGHALVCHGRGGFSGAGSLQVMLGGMLFGREPFGDGTGCRSLSGVFFKYLFLKFFLQPLAFNSLRRGRTLCDHTDLGRMRRRSFRCDALAHLFRQALLGGFMFDRSQARRFICSSAIPRCRCRPLFDNGTLLGSSCCPCFSLCASDGSGLQRLFGIGSRSRNARRFAVHFGARFGFRLCTLLDCSTRVSCCCGRPLGRNAFPGLRGEMPFLHFALCSRRARRLVDSGTITHRNDNRGFLVVGISAALHRLHQRTG